MGRSPCCEKVGLRRGRWTAEEDEILTNYIQANGEGSWRSLPKNAGLLRCGKSCRLRWINYLRTDLRRGNISREEEEVIVKLHSTLGNRWSLIASHLPGRTDNEIKNYWNSHLSRRVQCVRKFGNGGSVWMMDIPTKKRKGKTSRAAMSKNRINLMATRNGMASKKRPSGEIIPLPQPPTMENKTQIGSTSNLNSTSVLNDDDDMELFKHIIDSDYMKDLNVDLTETSKEGYEIGNFGSGDYNWYNSNSPIISRFYDNKWDDIFNEGNNQIREESLQFSWLWENENGGDDNEKSEETDSEKQKAMDAWLHDLATLLNVDSRSTDDV